LGIALLALLSGTGSGQLPAQQPQRQQIPPPTIRAEVALVNVVFSAMDSRNRVVTGLRREDFRLFEDRQPQTIEYFSEIDEASAVPLTIALLIDTSGSVKTKLESEKQTAAEFFRNILRKDKDIALIIQFDSDVNLVQDFTGDVDRLIDAMDSLEAGNSTSLYDAIFLAVEDKLRGEVGRRVIVAVTDGEDTNSRISKKQAIQSALRNDVLIYGIGVRGEMGANFGVLKDFAEESGGSFFSPRANPEEIRAAFRSIGEELKGQYSLAYRSTNTRKDGAYRTIDLRCTQKGVRVRTRRGYYAPRK
jgi:Ca-activated chloride channel family protein